MENKSTIQGLVWFEFWELKINRQVLRFPNQLERYFSFWQLPYLLLAGPLCSHLSSSLANALKTSLYFSSWKEEKRGLATFPKKNDNGDQENSRELSQARCNILPSNQFRIFVVLIDIESSWIHLITLFCHCWMFLSMFQHFIHLTSLKKKNRRNWTKKVQCNTIYHNWYRISLSAVIPLVQC